jgi:hypothetical protein
MSWNASSKNRRSTLVVDASSDLSWFGRTKAAIQGNVLLVSEAAGAAVCAVSVPLAAVTGKFYLAALVSLFGLGCSLRFVRLRKKLRQPDGIPIELQKSIPAWVTPVVGVLSAIEVALLVEATRLPVRVDQPGFETTSWWWVLAGFVVLFWLQRGWLVDRLFTNARSSN